MEYQTICTAYEAVATWDLNHSDSTDFEGLILALDMDRGGAGLCECHPGRPPVQLWEHTGSLSGSFFQKAVWTLMPGCNSLDGAQVLRDSLTGMFASRVQKNYIRSGRSQNLDLPEVRLNGQVYPMTCLGLAEIFNRSHAQVLSQMLLEAKAELVRRGGAENCRFIPVGELAGLYMAEYMIRETFLERPLLPDDRLRLCTRREDPAQIIEQGYQIYQQKYIQEKTIGKFLRLQVLRRTESGATSELLTLAKSDSTYSQLSQIKYVGPICIADGDPLTLYTDSDLHHISIPNEVLGSSGQLVCVEVGIKAEGDELNLIVKKQNGDTVRLPLSNII